MKFFITLPLAFLIGIGAAWGLAIILYLIAKFILWL